MDDKWVDSIDWNNVAVTVDWDAIRELQRKAFEFEEQQAALRNFAQEFPYDAFKIATGYDIDDVAKALEKIASAVAITVNEIAEGFVEWFRKLSGILSPSISDLMEALQAECREDFEQERSLRFWKQYSCTKYRKQNIYTFRNPYNGYRTPLPRRNNRVMTRRTI